MKGDAMRILSGKSLSALAAALALMAAAAAVRIGLSGDLGVPRSLSAAPARGEVLSAEAHLAMARDAERKGRIALALSCYRKAADLKPGLVDKRSSEFLGPGFERNLKEWASALKARRFSAGPAAMEDASYLFRRMYGGCG